MGVRAEWVFEPARMSTWYVGGGPRLEVSDFAERGASLGGAAALDLVLGYDFLRGASPASFVEVEAQAIAWSLELEGAEPVGLGGALQLGLRL